MNKPGIKKYIAESLLIVFSVLFALFINKLFDDYQTQQKKEVALKSITRELHRNAEIIKGWKSRHGVIRDRLISINKGTNDSTKNALRESDFFDLALLTNQENLIDNTLSKTAWESAKSTGIISEFDFETTEILTQVYTLQDLITDKTIGEIFNTYFDSETHKMDNLDQTLIQFQLRFWELTGQEELMMYLYAECIEKLD